MKRGISAFVAAIFLAGTASAQTPATAPDDSAKKNETVPSQQAAAAQAPAKPAAPAAPPKAELYGTINVNLQWARAINTPVEIAPRLAIATDSSNIGVRGGLQATDWLKAEYQCETSAAIDGIGIAGICGRNSKIGAAGTFGSIFYGNWDSPFKSLAYGTEGDDPFGNTDVWDMEDFMGSPGFRTRGVASKSGTFEANAAFSVRAANTVSYWTPKVMGASAKFQYGVNESKSINGRVSPKLWSANVVWDGGPFSVGGAYEVHEDAYGLAAIGAQAGARGGFSGTAAPAPTAAASYSSEDRAWRVMAGYELKLGDFGATTIGGMFEQLEYINLGRTTAGEVKSYDRYAWQASLKHRMGNHELRARFNKANDGACERIGGGNCSAVGYGASSLALGYAYHLAKTTQIYLHWIDIRNDRNATYTFASAGPNPLEGSASFAAAITPGQDPQSLGLGVRHAF